MKAAGHDEIVCVSVNDPFVMAAWGKDQNADGKVILLSVLYILLKLSTRMSVLSSMSVDFGRGFLKPFRN